MSSLARWGRDSARRPEDIIGEWGVRDVTPPSPPSASSSRREAELNPLIGRPLRRRIRRFRAEADRYLASLGGPLPYMQRLRQIDDEIEAHAARLAEAYAEHGATPADGAGSRSAGTSARSTT